jgi:hypothetical protein
MDGACSSFGRVILFEVLVEKKRRQGISSEIEAETAGKCENTS